MYITEAISICFEILDWKYHWDLGKTNQELLGNKYLQNHSSHIKRGRWHWPSTRERRSRPGNAGSFSIPPCKTHSKVSTLNPIPWPVRPRNFVTAKTTSKVRPPCWACSAYLGLAYSACFLTQYYSIYQTNTIYSTSRTCSLLLQASRGMPLKHHYRAAPPASSLPPEQEAGRLAQARRAEARLSVGIGVVQCGRRGTSSDNVGSLWRPNSRIHHPLREFSAPFAGSAPAKVGSVESGVGRIIARQCWLYASEVVGWCVHAIQVVTCTGVEGLLLGVPSSSMGLVAPGWWDAEAQWQCRHHGQGDRSCDVDGTRGAKETAPQQRADRERCGGGSVACLGDWLVTGQLQGGICIAAAMPSREVCGSYRRKVSRKSHVQCVKLTTHWAPHFLVEHVLMSLSSLRSLNF
jgi:hypothetical protein